MERADDLLNCIDAENRAIEFIRKELGSATRFVQDSIALYDILIDAASKKKSPTPRLGVLALLTAHCMHSLIGGTLSLWRGHSAVAKVHLRTAIESLLFSINLFERPDAAQSWLSLADDFQNYRDDFKIMRLLDLSKYANISETERKSLQLLIDRYEMCSLQVHPSYIAIAPNMGEQGTFSYIDAVSVNQIICDYWWTLDSHLHISKILAERFEIAVPGFKRHSWLQSMKRLDEEMVLFMRIRRSHESSLATTIPANYEEFWKKKDKRK